MNQNEQTLMRRREFLSFFGKSAALLSLAACAPSLVKNADKVKDTSIGAFQGLKPMISDDFRVAPGFSYKRLLSWGDVINVKGEQFGFNNDFIAIFPVPNRSDEFVMWVNHEYTHPLFVCGHDMFNPNDKKTKVQVDEEMKTLGGSLIHLRKVGESYEFILNSEYNRRVTANTPIPFSNNEKIAGSNIAIGTFCNCAGGVTPWGTVLSGEENFHNYVGDLEYSKDGKYKKVEQKFTYEWDKYYPERSPLHYGWVVEVNPFTGKAQKHTGLGRFSHEGATAVRAKDGRVVVYSGDDAADECFYKFVSDSKDNLKKGTLYVANLEKGEWIPLTMAHPVLKKEFNNQMEILMFTRRAAKLVGGTPLDRPEDCEVDPNSGHVYLNCTNNKKAGRPFGTIYKFVEADDHTGTKFKASAFLRGGPESGIASPDNMVFDRKGNLWVTTDISDENIGDKHHLVFGNNALFYIPMSGPNAGSPIRVVEGPIESELTGPCFSPDGRTLFLSVQHPGGNTKSLDKLTSHWPEGGNSIPKPTVVQIRIPDFLL